MPLDRAVAADGQSVKFRNKMEKTVGVGWLKDECSPETAEPPEVCAQSRVNRFLRA